MKVLGCGHFGYGINLRTGRRVCLVCKKQKGKNMKQYILESLENELKLAKSKWPGWVSDPIHASAILAEEAGEVVQATLKYTYEGGSKKDIEKETLQTMAMCYRLLECMKDYKPEEKFL